MGLGVLQILLCRFELPLLLGVQGLGCFQLHTDQHHLSKSGLAYFSRKFILSNTKIMSIFNNKGNGLHPWHAPRKRSSAGMASSYLPCNTILAQDT